ncbi:MAG: hypothetical protein KAR06_05075, partial [Deltaproteobacteria bacterium]|nr:hypothetical protein [Deltaproteobacteria bacterium]
MTVKTRGKDSEKKKNNALPKKVLKGGSDASSGKGSKLILSSELSEKAPLVLSLIDAGQAANKEDGDTEQEKEFLYDPVKVYFKDMRMGSLLSREEEVSFAMKIESAREGMTRVFLSSGLLLSEVELLIESIMSRDSYTRATSSEINDSGEEADVTVLLRELKNIRKSYKLILSKGGDPSDNAKLVVNIVGIGRRSELFNIMKERYDGELKNIRSLTRSLRTHEKRLGMSYKEMTTVFKEIKNGKRKRVKGGIDSFYNDHEKVKAVRSEIKAFEKITGLKSEEFVESSRRLRAWL